ncbi:MAG TPA: gluconate 2-dehydrogenase subunit 3 family protein [Bryobacteraceae bacterium]|nr:gluconate 2-dehydrogenase subunit 3 family protein [Bryobacteraceae bacterium]
MSKDNERRQSLKIIGTIGATCAFPFAADELYAQQEHTHTEGVTAQLPEPKYFSKEDFALVAEVAEAIIPATDTPGAIAAGVPAYIDFVVGRSEPQQKLFKAGLAWMKKHKLKDLEPLCAAVDKGAKKTPEQRWFRAMKNLTADGYWTSKTGMAQTLGYKGAAMLAEYPECREH